MSDSIVDTHDLEQSIAKMYALIDDLRTQRAKLLHALHGIMYLVHLLNPPELNLSKNNVYTAALAVLAKIEESHD